MGGDAGVSLGSVQGAALDAASADADGIRRASRERARQIVEQARGEAAAILARRQADAERLADLEERERLAEARTEARAIVLRAQRTVLVHARSAAQGAVRRLIDDPRYGRLLECLSADARELLAPAGAAQITILPAGGLLARAASCEIDYSLETHAKRCFEAMASEVERLWR
jgi:vacuolar-type H+-ATPase subunit E/Vma4